MNKFVDFVSDEDFLECINHVINIYPNFNNFKTSREVLTKSDNTIDEFKMIFDMCMGQMNIDAWSKFELNRQKDKSINNKVGEFHQKLLGKVDGWIDLGIGDETEIDLKKEDNSIFIELKNKHNTMNSSSKDQCREKLENIIEKYPDAIAYWAYIISKNYKSENKIWIYKQRENERIKIISGYKVYELVTGDPKALEKTFNAIPKAIIHLFGEEYSLSKEDKLLLKEYNNMFFK